MKKGSSPRVRGKLAVTMGWGACDGLIPARAGKTSRRSCPPSRTWAHPRACGENEYGMPRPAMEVGSSPRVRGKPPAVGVSAPLERLIPARAGKTSECGTGGHGPGAHPRACGENETGWVEVGGEWGSSPRVRGKRTEQLTDLERGGLIPARAGKTVLS